MKQIKKFGVVQTAKVCAAIYLVVSAVIFVPVALIGLIGSGEAASLLLILLPLVYAALGFVGVAIFCWIYNLIAGKVGGVEIELE